MLDDLVPKMDSGFDRRRFVPFVVMHEFEGLLFSNCEAFSRAIGRPNLESKFRAIRDQFGTPEEINDSPETAPSKRVEAPVPEYENRFSVRWRFWRSGSIAFVQSALNSIIG